MDSGSSRETNKMNLENILGAGKWNIFKWQRCVQKNTENLEEALISPKLKTIWARKLLVDCIMTSRINK